MKRMTRLTSHLMEVRFQPQMTALDFRGQWAEEFRKRLNLPIADVDLHGFKVRGPNAFAFMSYRNLGYQVDNPDDPSQFVTKSTEVIKLAISKLGKPVQVIRVGVRQKIATPFEGSLAELIAKYQAHYGAPYPATLAAWGGRLVDIGMPLNFEDESGMFNTTSGAMTADQLSQYMDGDSEDLPRVSLYTEIDYFAKDEQNYLDNKLYDLLSRLSAGGLEKVHQAQRLILGDN